MTRIYRVDMKLYSSCDAASPRLIRAKTRAQAERHVSKQIIESRVASQDDMIELLDRGVEVEEGGEAEGKTGDGRQT